MDNRASTSGVSGSVRARVQAIDLNSQQDKEIEEGNVQGVCAGRNVACGPWSNDELLVLCTANKEWSKISGLNSTNRHFLHQMATQKWINLLDHFFELGINRSANQCNDKWDQTRVDFEKVYDYEKNVPSGNPSFWSYPEGEAKRLFKLKTIMKREVYDHIISWLPKTSHDVAPENLMDRTMLNDPSGM